MMLLSANQLTPQPLTPRPSLASMRYSMRSIVVFSVVLSLGPYLQITYAANDYDPNAVQRIIPLPYLLLYDWVPGFQSMRVTTRIGVLTTLALAVLAGFGAYYIWRLALGTVDARRCSLGSACGGGGAGLAARGRKLERAHRYASRRHPERRAARLSLAMPNSPTPPSWNTRRSTTSPATPTWRCRTSTSITASITGTKRSTPARAYILTPTQLSCLKPPIVSPARAAWTLCACST